MSDFDKIKIKLSFSCGVASKQEDEWLLSDYWSEEEWNSSSEKEKDLWLDDFYNDWKSNHEDGAVWLEYED